MKLLIVEDQQFTREGQISVLRALYHDIEIVEAVSIAQATNIPKKESFDYIFLDYGLPDSEGVDSLLSIQELFMTAKVIVVSGSEEAMMVRIAIKNKAHGFLPKSFQGEELINTLKTLLSGIPFFPAWVIIEEVEKEDEDEVNRNILERLTNRQKEVVQRLFDAKADKIIADELGIQVGTVRRHDHDVFRAFGVRDRMQLLAYLKDSEFWVNEIKRMKLR